jgi:hypothetical protein
MTQIIKMEKLAENQRAIEARMERVHKGLASMRESRNRKIEKENAVSSTSLLKKDPNTF